MKMILNPSPSEMEEFFTETEPQRVLENKSGDVISELRLALIDLLDAINRDCMGLSLPMSILEKRRDAAVRALLKSSGKEEKTMTLFEEITKSSETLAEYLASDKDNHGCDDCSHAAACSGKKSCREKWLIALNGEA